MSHTVAPWKVLPDEHGRKSGNAITTEDGNLIGMTMLSTRLPSEACAENARRIVACVNACEGIPTEALECQAKKDLTGQLLGVKDDLLETLEGTLRNLNKSATTGYYELHEDNLESIVTAIERARRGPA